MSFVATFHENFRDRCAKHVANQGSSNGFVTLKILKFLSKESVRREGDVNSKGETG